MAYSNYSRRYSHRGGRIRQHFPQPAPAVLPRPQASQIRIESIASISLTPRIPSGKAQIENVEYVASFSWANMRDPTILVPGTPPKWQPLANAQKLREDDGHYYRDPNSAHFPSFPTEPAIRAICEQSPGFNLSEIDIFGCGNTMGSLLSFVSGEERTFRFGVDYIDSSLFLVRKTNKPAELIEDVRGYGHTFPESYTQWEKSVKSSLSHQRIIKYDFAGLKCFVRSESDGYLPALIGKPGDVTNVPYESQQDFSNSDQLLNLALGHKASSGSNKLVVQHAGHIVPQRAIFDLKTRSTKSTRQDVSVEGFLHRLWVNQTPNMILAYHTSGTFNPSDVHVIDARSKIAAWEATNVVTLSKLGALLHQLIAIAKQDGRLRFEVRRMGTGPLEIWSETSKWSALSSDLKKRLGVSVPQENQANEGEGSGRGTQSSEDEDEDEDYLRF